jgi:hypothetical protein
MINFDEVKSIVSKFSPILASAISTANPFAGMFISLIASVFGANENDSKDIVNKINSNENAYQKLKELELQHKDLLSNNYVEDKESARNREEKITEILKKRDYVMESIAVAVVIGYFAMCSITVFYSIPLADHDMLNMLFGQLMGGFMMVLSYYFGSSNK